jgi:Ca2+-binding RTX toxin-like protein
MSNFSMIDAVSIGVDDLDFDLPEVLFMETPTGTIAIALNGASGGVTTYSVMADGSLDYISSRSYTSGTRDLQTTQSIVVTISGARFVIVGVDSDGEFYGHVISDNGNVSKLNRMPATDKGALGGVVSMVEIANDGETSQVVIVTDEGFVQLRFVTKVDGSVDGLDTIELFQADIAHIEVLNICGNTVFVTSEYLTGDIVSYSYNSVTHQTQEVGRGGSSYGVGLGTPTDFTTVVVDSINYVVAASSTSNSLSVFEVQSGGALLATDHVLDTLYTLFSNANIVESFSVNGNEFVIVAGADAGLSLFTVLPGGQLVLIENLLTSNDMPLADIQSLSVVQDNNQTYIHATSEAIAGITILQFDDDAWAAPQFDGASGSTLVGTGQNEVLFGGSGDDVIVGGGGDDILNDGWGTDLLTGGAGNDVFVMTLDGEDDTITQFQAGVDRIDLSDYTFTYSPSALNFTQMSGGIRLWFETERLDIYSDTGYELTIEDIFGSNFIQPDRPHLANAGEVYGTDSNDIIHGTRLNEYIVGMVGNDEIDGNDGDDTIFGNDGDDTLSGGNDNDGLYGGAGNDRLSGGAGADTLAGNVGADVLFGGDGDDRLFGGNDNDVLSGEDGEDEADGGDGSDRIYGHDGDDTLNGGAGNDELSGGNDNDTLRGDDGDDTLSGGNGADTLSGNVGADVLFGGEGDDRLFGGNDNDVLSGGAGSDALNGGAGADIFVFTTVSDSIHGSQRDTISDFTHNEDQIDLSGIVTGMSFIGDGTYSNTAGEVRYNDAIGRLYIDVDGDGASDLSIDVSDAPTIDLGDLIL